VSGSHRISPVAPLWLTHSLGHSLFHLSLRFQFLTPRFVLFSSVAAVHCRRGLQHSPPVQYRSPACWNIIISGVWMSFAGICLASTSMCMCMVRSISLSLSSVPSIINLSLERRVGLVCSGPLLTVPDRGLRNARPSFSIQSNAFLVGRPALSFLPLASYRHRV
jgi:hypothetical protein